MLPRETVKTGDLLDLNTLMGKITLLLFEGLVRYWCLVIVIRFRIATDERLKVTDSLLTSFIILVTFPSHARALIFQLDQFSLLDCVCVFIESVVLYWCFL